MIKLGQKVTDVVTGFTGIAYERCEYLVGETLIGVMPRCEDNKPAGIAYFAEERLMVSNVAELMQLKYQPTE